MKLFIPELKDKQLAQEEYDRIKKVAKSTNKWNITNRKIFKIKYTNSINKKDYTAEVGQRDENTGLTIIAIFESLEAKVFLICTAKRGFIIGEEMPILIGKKEVYSIEDFE